MENQKDFIKKILIISAIACFASLFWNFIVPLVIAAGLIGYQFYLLHKKEDEIKQVINNHKYQIKELEDKVKELDTKERLEEISTLEKRLETLKSDIKDRQKQLQNVTNEYQNLNQTINIQKAAADSEINLELTKQTELIKKEAKKVSKFRELYKSIKYSINNFFEYDPSSELLTFKQEDLNLVDAYAPSVFLHLQYMNSKELRKAYRENDKQITKLMEQYSSRYTTKSNKAMYSLMVIALRSELQNILSDLKYGTIDKATDKIKEVTMKYLEIAGNGNQQIYGTLTKFIGQLEYLFINAAKIEYNYYVKKEKEKQEQLALKEKMRQEAAELKALEAEKKKIAKEEDKYKAEIDKVKEQLKNAAQEEMDILNKRILELQNQLSDVVLKKEEISNLQNGKAGTVYIISNLGSFGEDVFKVGMTRRLEPQDRVNELGSASVPFKFDVHSFIFSEDAVALESKLHQMLTDKRVNKVNLRKEFFKVSIDELEKLVEEIEPTAEFNRTMLASEYRASLETNGNYSDDSYSDDEEDEDE